MEQRARQGLSQSCSWIWNLSMAHWRLLSRTSCRDTAGAKRSWQTFPEESGTCRQPSSPQGLGITASPTQGHAPGTPCCKGQLCRGRLDFGMEEKDIPGRRPWNSFSFLPGWCPWCLRVTNAELKSILPSESCTHSKIQ